MKEIRRKTEIGKGYVYVMRFTCVLRIEIASNSNRGRVWDRWLHSQAYCRRINVDLFRTVTFPGTAFLSAQARVAWIPKIWRGNAERRNWAKSIPAKYTYGKSSNLKHACRPVESIFGNRKAIMAAARFVAEFEVQPNRGEPRDFYTKAPLSTWWTHVAPGRFILL